MEWGSGKPPYEQKTSKTKKAYSAEKSELRKGRERRNPTEIVSYKKEIEKKKEIGWDGVKRSGIVSVKRRQGAEKQQK